MKKIKLFESMMIAGKHCEADQVVEVKDQDGYYLVNGKRAKFVSDKTPKTKKVPKSKK